MSSAMTVQTVLYGTSPQAILASAVSVADAVAYATAKGFQ
jgi:hypothetical protein